jgi:DNA-binding CsgD family transcriptional regulator/Flp pilus assembly protein TadD
VATPAPDEVPLLEREAESALLGSLLKEARAGHGCVAVIEGAAGIGKTRLLGAARAAASAHDMRVLAARGGRLESEVPFGIVRQLFELALRRSDADERESLLAGAGALARPILELEAGAEAADPALDRSFSVLHGLYWLTSNLAEHASLVLAVDDAHWADPPSLRFIDYLARRVEELPVLLLVARRPAEPSSQPNLLRSLAADPAATVMRPAPLTAGATAAIVRVLLGEDADDEFCRSCHAATSGNPFLLRALTSALKAEHIHPTPGAAERVKSMAPGAIAQSLFVRLAQLPPAAGALARAVAVLGADAELRHAAALAGLDPQDAAEAADALALADILERGRPLEFVHPVVREAVYADLAPGERARAHAAAARILRDAQAAPDHIAVQLLAAEPDGLEWAVLTLRRAAIDALARGAPSAAAVYLRRALAEPPPQDVRPEVIRELGRAEARLGDPAAIEHLTQALEATAPGRPRAEAARELARALIPLTRFEEAVAALGDAIAQLPASERELALHLEAEAMTAGRLHPATYAHAAQRLERFAHGVRGDTAGERAMLANLAFHRCLEGGSAREALALAERALVGGLLAEQSSAGPSFFDALYTVIAADAFDLAERFCDAALADARARGSLLDFAMVSAFRSELAYRQGRLVEAETDARASLEAARLGQSPFAANPLAHLIDVLIERGEPDAALDALADSGSAEIPDLLVTNFLLFSRARLRLARGELENGIADLRELAARERRSHSPRMFPYRSTLAVAYAALGRTAEARRLAAEELELARCWNTPRAVGMALRAHGLVEPGESATEDLRRAVATLADSRAALEHARALTDLGAVLRRAGRRAEARDPLRQGLDLAHRCGASALEQRALQELRASGARPRTPLRTGLDSLTASESRIAAMAADGQSNREIAQSLFLSLKTVEMHLSASYRKLDVHSRSELAETLARFSERAREDSNL